jgi:hypothetical protein
MLLPHRSRLVARPVARLLFVNALFSMTLVAAMTPAIAQKPGLGYVYPPAIPAGQSSTVTLGGYDFTIDMDWFVHEDKIQLQVTGGPGEYLVPPPPFWIGPRTSLPAMPIPREVAGTIIVPAEMPAGLVRWQVANANGASETAVVYVSRANEIVENRSRDLPQKLETLPVAVSGRLSRLTEVDRYEIQLDQDQLVTVDLMARRLGSDINGVVQVRDEAGALIADFVDTAGVDGRLHFRAAAGHRYIVSVNDLDFRGDRAYVYRLAISTGPAVVKMLPARAQRGSTVAMEFLGPGLKTGGRAMESIVETVTISADAQLQTQAHTITTFAGTTVVDIPISDMTESARPPENSQPESQPFALEGPGAVTGRFSVLPARHAYSWPVTTGEHWSLDVNARALWSDVDVSIEVLDETGKPVAENDDGPVNSDASVQFHAASTGIYAAVIRGLPISSQSDDATYRFQLVRQSPDFSLSTAQQFAMPLGGKAELTVNAIRLGGFDGEIRLQVDNLPDGVKTIGDWVIPAGKTDAKVSLESSADAAVVARPVRITGVATVNSATEPSEVQRPVLAAAGGVLNPLNADERFIPQILLAMTMPAPIEVLVVDKERQRDVHRGTTYLAELDVVRKDGFTGEVNLEMTAKQDRQRMGTRGPILTVPPGETKAWYPVFLPEWLPMDLTRRIIVHGVVAVPDPKGRIRNLTKAGNARITMIMEGALLKLTAANNDSVVPIGSVVEIPVTISRSPKLPLPVTVTLDVPEEARGFLKAEPVTVAADQTTAILRIESQADHKLSGQWTLMLTATALQDDQWPVVSQTDVRVEFRLP